MYISTYTLEILLHDLIIHMESIPTPVERANYNFKGKDKRCTSIMLIREQAEEEKAGRRRNDPTTPVPTARGIKAKLQTLVFEFSDQFHGNERRSRGGSKIIATG